MNNVQKLIQAGLILGTALPSPADQATINALNSSEVDGMIHIYNTVGSSFLSGNCGVSSPGPGPGRTIGIVF